MLRKRCRSPDDDFCPQLKTHVGEKEINSGVNREDNMKAVYAKTLGILFNASPKKVNKESTPTAAQNLHAPAWRYKQMFLDRNCKLKIQGNLEESQFQSTCGFCGILNYVLHKCTFCEKYLCESCKCACRKCEQHFCSLCIFSVFEGSDEYTICQSCY